MTDLSEIIQQCHDTIFKVKFKKKVTQDEVEERFKKANLEDEKQIKELSKILIDGEQCEIRGHLIESETNLGRSLIIDLDAPPKNNFR